MKKVTTSVLMAVLAFNISCSTMKQNSTTEVATTNQNTSGDESMKNNPFMTKSKLQYEAPEFDKIKDSDVIKIKIKEVINQSDKINPGKIVKDNHVMVLMLSYELLKEIKRQIKE